jgi:hypothetical protein
MFGQPGACEAHWVVEHATILHTALGSECDNFGIT